MDNLKSFEDYIAEIRSCTNVPQLDAIMEIASNDRNISTREFVTLCFICKKIISDFLN